MWIKLVFLEHYCSEVLMICRVQRKLILTNIYKPESHL